MFGNRVLGTYVATALTHILRQSPASERPWYHTIIVAGADKLRGDVLDRLMDACETSRTGLVLTYRSLTPTVRERLGRGHAAVAFMRLGNAEDARVASEHVGTEHRLELAQLTETISESLPGLDGGYTSDRRPARGLRRGACREPRRPGRGHHRVDRVGQDRRQDRREGAGAAALAGVPRRAAPAPAAAHHVRDRHRRHRGRAAGSAWPTRTRPY